VQVFPSDGKYGVGNLVPFGFGVLERAQILVRLFRDLGFDADGEHWYAEDGTKYFFNSCETVANLIDFMDLDSDPMRLEECEGFENQNSKHLFGNFRLEREQDLLLVPGFTFDRAMRALPFIQIVNAATAIDINSAPAEIFQAIDPNIKSIDLEEILNFRASEQGPFVQFKLAEQLGAVAPGFNFNLTQRLFKTENDNYEIVGKLSCGAGVFFNKSYVRLARIAGGRIAKDTYRSFRLKY
jgi:hypothetical protein